MRNSAYIKGELVTILSVDSNAAQIYVIYLDSSGNIKRTQISGSNDSDTTIISSNTLKLKSKNITAQNQWTDEFIVSKGTFMVSIQGTITNGSIATLARKINNQWVPVTTYNIETSTFGTEGATFGTYIFGCDTGDFVAGDNFTVVLEQ